MKTLFVFAVALGLVFVVKAEEDHCFDKARTDAEWIPVRDECKGKATATEKAERLWEVGLCMMKAKNLVSEDNVVDYEKYLASVLDLAVNHKAELEAVVTECWKNKDDETPTLSFFTCAKLQFNELCPDSKKWDEEAEN